MDDKKVGLIKMEFIFILIGLGLLFLFFKAKSQVRSSEFGKEARHIAINELGVHPGYFNYCVQNDIENIKEAALDIKKMSSFMHPKVGQDF